MMSVMFDDEFGHGGKKTRYGREGGFGTFEDSHLLVFCLDLAYSLKDWNELG